MQVCVTARSRADTLNFYAIENLTTGEVVRRGTSPGTGIPRNGLILANNTNYREWLFDPGRNLIGFVDFSTPSAGFRFDIPAVPLRLPRTPDTDGDGLSNDAEFVLGTNPTKADTDGDGISDGAALQSGLNPAAGAVTGIIGTADTPGTATDICALNDVVVVADSAAGVSIFNVFNRMAPLIIAQVDTPGTAQAVACSGTLVAVADGAAGLAVIDIADPPAARVVHQVLLGASVTAVAAAGGLGFAGLANGQVVAVDLAGGVVLQQVAVGGPVQDLGLGNDHLYVVTADRLYVMTLDPFAVVGSVSAPGALPGAWRRRLFVGEKVAYINHARGYNIFDLTNPTQPVLLRDYVANQFYWKQVVANGSGSALIAHGVSTGNENHFVHLYQVGDQGTNTQFVTTFPTPGIAVAVSIYNGLGYVADSAAGLHVINYYTTDTRRQPPTISIATSASDSGIEEGRLLRVSAHVTDDVQVRNVEFYLDGAKVATDGSYPFEHRFTAPLRTPQKTSFVVRARASDTGGNATWSDSLTIHLLPDRTPPYVLRTFPAASQPIGSVNSVVVTFSEGLLPATVTPANFRLTNLGPDRTLNTGDDTPVSGVQMSYLETLNSAVMNLGGDLSTGQYELTVQNVADAAGNVMSRPFTALLRIFGQQDSDHDGVPDDVEIALSLNPFNPDTDLDGIPDGQEDSDGDGLPNTVEIAAGTNPQRKDSDYDGVLDANEDPDQDSLVNSAEAAAGTDPGWHDTDGDGFNDGAEVIAGSNPLDASDRPLGLYASTPAALVSTQPPRNASNEVLGVTAAQPPLAIISPALSLDTNGAVRGVTAAQPPVAIISPALSLDTDGAVRGVWPAKPTVVVSP